MFNEHSKIGPFVKSRRCFSPSPKFRPRPSIGCFDAFASRWSSRAISLVKEPEREADPEEGRSTLGSPLFPSRGSRAMEGEGGGGKVPATRRNGSQRRAPRRDRAPQLGNK